MEIAVLLAVAGSVLAAGGLVAIVRCRREVARLHRTADEFATALHAHEQRQRLVTVGRGLCPFELDLLAGTATWSPELEALHGLEPGTFGGTMADMVAFAASPADVTTLEHCLARVVVGGDAETAVRIRRTDGEERWLEVQVQALTVDGTATGRGVGVAVDITDRKRAESELEHLARHDPLTQLPNRDQLLAELAAVLAGPSHGALLLLDLDGFKEINDALGHGTGDVVLVEVADRLSASVRDLDLVARLGGDEFAIVIRDVADEKVAVMRTERLLAALAAPVTVSGMALHVVGSVGVALWPHHGTTPSALLQHADVAMYRAKTRGNCAVVYDALQDHGRVSKLALVGELRGAIDDDAIDVHYQPIVDLGTDRIVGMEALARWRRPAGDVPPGVFVPLAEQSGLIRELTPLVLRKAIDEARDWAENGLDLRVSVNMSARVLADPGFANDVTFSLVSAGLEPSKLILEITETALAEPTPSLIRALHDLRDSGVSIALDDFGAGYSSLGLLAELPVDILKIDRSFLSRLPAPAAVGMVRAIIEMAGHLGIETVAEGVEGGADASLLRELGCGFAQGYHFGRPAPSVDVEAVLGARLF